jgi:phage shock protein PspC (stress-responsive transcriptional regulator)
MTNQPADAARPDQAPDEPSLAPPAPPPGPLWPAADASAPSAGSASADGWPVPEASVDGASGSPAAPTSGPAAPVSGPAAPTSGTPGAPGGDQGAAPEPGATGGAGGTGSGFGGQFAPGGQFGPGFMARYGLVRPVTGRNFAGVCAAVGRATNTDPILWRVLFAVLTLFGGSGCSPT